MTDRTTKVTLLAEVNGYLSNMDKAAKKTREMSKDSAEAMAKQKEAFDLVGRASLTAGTLALAGAALAAKAAIDWETAWTGVTKTVDGTPEQLNAIEEGLRGMSRELPIAHAELAAVAEAAGQLGVGQESILTFTKTMVDLGQTTNLSAEEAATSLARFANVMGTSLNDVDRLGAAIVGLGNSNATTESEILAMSMRLAGAGRQASLTEGEVFGLAAAMSSVGIEAEAGGTAMSLTMKRITKEVETGGDKLGLFAEVAGMSSEQFAKAWEDDAATALSTFVGGLGEAEKLGKSTTAVLTELGVTGIRESDALLRLSSAQGLMNESMAQGNKEISENTALINEANKRYDTAASKIQVAANSAVDAAISFGQVFLPAVGAASDKVTEITGNIADMHPIVLGVAGAVTVAGAAVAVTGGAFLLAVPKIAAYRAALVTLGPVAQRTAKALGGLSKFAGILVAIGFIHEMKGWGDSLYGAAHSADELEKSLGNVQDTASTVSDALGGGGFLYGFGANASQNLDLLSSDFGNFLAEVQNSWVGTGVELATFGLANQSLGVAKKNVEELDGAMANLVAGGKTQQAAKAWEELVAQTDGSEEAIDKLKKQFPQYEAALDGATDGTQNNSAAIAELEGAASDAGDQVSGLSDLIRNFGATSLSARDAERAFQASIDDATEALKENGKTLDIDTEAGRANEAALDGIARASLEAAASILEQTGSQEDATAAINNGRDALIDQLAKFGITGDKAEAYADKLGLIPANVKTAVELNVDGATAKLQNWLRLASGNTVRIAMGAGGSGGMTMADGGAVTGRGGPREDNIPIMASVGEHMLDAEDVRRMGGQGAVYAFRESLHNGQFTTAMHAPAPVASPAVSAGGFDSGTNITIAGNVGYNPQELAAEINIQKRKSIALSNLRGVGVA